MNLPLFIARRYFLAPRKRSFINILTWVSMLGVAVGTMALVVVLSAFNGLQDLVRTLFNRLDPDLRIEAAAGKTFTYSPGMADSLGRLQGVHLITPAIEDNALLKYEDAQMVVRMKGVADNFRQHGRFEGHTYPEQFDLRRGKLNFALIGIGVANSLNISLSKSFSQVQLWYPKPGLKGGGFNPENAFNKQSLLPGAIFEIEPQFDDKYVVVPLEFARELTQLPDQVSYLELQVSPGEDIAEVQQRLQTQLGSRFRVLTSDEQHASLLRILRIEKAFIFLALSLILLISGFNIFVSLSVLVLDKQRDILVLKAMGAGNGLIYRIFLAEGGIVAFTGAGLGLAAGYALCWAQQKYELVSMGVETSIVNAYPVKPELYDFLGIAALIIVLTVLAARFPARRAAQLKMQRLSGNAGA